ECWGGVGGRGGRAAERMDKMPYPDRGIKGWDGKPVVLKGKETKARQSGFLRNFAKSMATLKGIAEKELAQKELSKEEVQFIENTVQLAIGCGGPRRHPRWDPGVVFEGARGAGQRDAPGAGVP